MTETNHYSEQLLEDLLDLRLAAIHMRPYEIGHEVVVATIERDLFALNVLRCVSRQHTSAAIKADNTVLAKGYYQIARLADMEFRHIDTANIGMPDPHGQPPTLLAA